MGDFYGVLFRKWTKITSKWKLWQSSHDENWGSGEIFPGFGRERDGVLYFGGNINKVSE